MWLNPGVYLSHLTPVCLYSFMYGSNWECYSTWPHCQWFPLIVCDNLRSPYFSQLLPPRLFPLLPAAFHPALIHHFITVDTVCSVWADVSQVTPLQIDQSSVSAYDTLHFSLTVPDTDKEEGCCTREFSLNSYHFGLKWQLEEKDIEPNFWEFSSVSCFKGELH